MSHVPVAQNNKGSFLTKATRPLWASRGALLCGHSGTQTERAVITSNRITLSQGLGGSRVSCLSN